MDDPERTLLINGIQILAALALVLLNSLFVAAEFAFVRARPTRIAQLADEGNRRARAAQICIDNIDEYLSVSQLGITLASLGLGWLGEPAVADLLAPLLFRMGIESLIVIHSISFVVAFGLITFMHVVFGELAPKSLAIQHAESTALRLATPMRFFYYLFLPGVLSLNQAANGFLRVLGMKPASDRELAHSEEELRMLIAESYKGGHINRREQELLQNVFRFEDRVVWDVMVPRTETVFLDKQDSYEHNLQIARQAGHTRFPLSDGSTDNLIGLIHIKDLFLMAGSVRDIEQIKREILFVPEGMPLERLLYEFQRNRQHMAAVVDEYGGVAGIVTMENVLEELVGQIQDEFDREEPLAIARADGSFLVSGRMLLDEAKARYGLPVDEEDEEYSTLAGYLIARLGRFPREGDTVAVAGIKLEVTKMKGKRIDRITLTPAPRVSEEAEFEENFNAEL